MIGPLSRDEFAALVAAGEDSFTEFKDPRLSNTDLAKELCAFSNAGGGRIVVGVDDDGRIVGCDGWDEERVMNIARTAVDPAIIPSYQRLLWNGLTVVIVGIEQGVEKPYAWVAGQETRRYFMRVGSTSREATREELIRLTQASGAVASDLRPVVGATLADLDPELLRQRFEGLRSLRYDELDDAEQRRVLIAAEILHPEGGTPTIGGLLCYGRTPQERLSFAVVSCVAYPGETVGAEFLDRLEAWGRVEQQIDDGAGFVERNLRVPGRIEGVRREDAPRPSRNSIREVIANAVCHRHYGINGPVQVRVFSDRLEVLSPGGLPNGVTPEAMRVGISIRRNQFVLQHLATLRIVDALGRGIVVLFEEALELGLREPRIQSAETWTQVTLFFGP